MTRYGAPAPGVLPGEVLIGEGGVVVASGEEIVLEVLNTGDRPVQVGSHFHFAEANEALRVDRTAAWGRRLAIAAGTAVRFEPGIARAVALVPLAGRRRVHGLRRLAGGDLDGPSAGRHG